MPPVAAAVSPVRKSRVDKHGRELAVGGSVGRRTQRKPRVGRERIIRVIRPETAPPAESPPIRQRQEQNKAPSGRRTGGALISYIVCRVTGFEPATLWSQTRYAYRTAPAPERCQAPPEFHKKADHPIEQSADLSGRLDSNQRPPTPEAGALTGLRYTPNKCPYRFKSAQR